LDRLVFGGSLSSRGLKADLEAVVEEEYRRIVSKYEGCVESSGVEVDWGVLIAYPEGVVDELPAWYIKYVFSLSEVLCRSYRIVYVSGRKEFELGRVEVYMFDGGCNVVKHVSERGLANVAEDIEAGALESE
jgi:hypothetical protein